MSKLKKEVLKNLESRVGKFDAELVDFVEKVVTPKMEHREEVNETLTDVKKKYEDILINGIEDTVTFMETKDTLSKLEETLEKSISECDDVVKLQKEFEVIQNDKIYNDFIKYGCENSVNTEFNNNVLVLQKQMFKKFLEIEKICNQMKDMDKEYQGVIRRVKHPKTQYAGTNALPFIMSVHQRFNVPNMVAYFTGVTTEKGKFEY